MISIARVASVVLVACLLPGFAGAGEIVERPELLERFAKLRPIYPAVPVEEERTRVPTEDSVGSSIDVSDEELFGPPAVVELRGVIEPGDAERLSAAFAGRDVWLVLSSPGGSFQEGLALGEVIKSTLNDTMSSARLNGVAVLAGEECMSACALAFALSKGSMQSVPLRYIERGGKVGFHMPFIASDALAESQLTARDALTLATRIVSQLNQLAIDDANPPEFLQEILDTKDGEFFELTADLDGWMWGFTPVAVDAYSQPARGNEVHAAVLRKLCDVFSRTQFPSRFRIDHYSPMNPDDVEQFDREIDGLLALPDEVNVALAPLSPLGTTCLVRRGADGTVGIGMPITSPPCLGGAAAEGAWCQTSRMELSTVTRGFLAEAYGCDDPSKPPGVDHATTREVTRLRAAEDANRIRDIPAGTELGVYQCTIDANGDVWYRVDAEDDIEWVRASKVDPEFRTPY